MSTVIAEKYRTKDFHYSRRDLNSFFTRLQEQSDEVASWSDETIKKCKSVLTRMLIETEYLDSSKSEQLNPILIDQELKGIMYHRHPENHYRILMSKSSVAATAASRH